MLMNLLQFQVLNHSFLYQGKVLQISDLIIALEDGMMSKIKECAMITVGGLEVKDVKILNYHIGLAPLRAQLLLTRRKENFTKEMRI